LRPYDDPVFVHTIELLDGTRRKIECLVAHAPPLLITVDDVRYIAVPVMTVAQAQRPWRYVPYSGGANPT
jgi:hypothetical protein